MKVTLDTNIWVSAFNFGGAAQRILDMAESGAIKLVTSEAIIEEVLEVLGRKFDWTVPELKMARNRIGQYAEIARPTETIWVWLLWNDGQEAQNQRVERRMRCLKTCKRPGYGDIPGLSAATSRLGVLIEGSHGELLQAM